MDRPDKWRAYHRCESCYWWEPPMAKDVAGKCYLGPTVNFKKAEALCADWACPWCEHGWRGIHATCGPHMGGGR